MCNNNKNIHRIRRCICYRLSLEMYYKKSFYGKQCQDMENIPQGSFFSQFLTMATITKHILISNNIRF